LEKVSSERSKRLCVDVRFAKNNFMGYRVATVGWGGLSVCQALFNYQIVETGKRASLVIYTDGGMELQGTDDGIKRTSVCERESPQSALSWRNHIERDRATNRVRQKSDAGG